MVVIEIPELDEMRKRLSDVESHYTAKIEELNERIAKIELAAAEVAVSEQKKRQSPSPWDAFQKR